MAERDLSGCTLGDFVLREPLGRGGYGTVYRSEQPLLKRNVVVKVLHERRQRNDVSRERFLREAQLASQLDHPYAAHIYAFGAEDDDGLLWIAMELVHGITLADRLEAHGPMLPEQFVPFFDRIAEVVQAAHERGIVHCDLKPSNVMVIERGGRLFPKLLDFGIAKLNPEIASPMPASWPEGSLAENHEPADARGADAPGPHEVVMARIRATPQRVRRNCANPDGRPLTGSSGSGACLGSFAYMPPEQWRDPEAVGPAADIYSLGVVAYQCLKGRAPFNAENADDYYRKHRYSEVPSLGGAFAQHIDPVIRRALAKYPQARYRNVLELASALRAALRVSERERLQATAQQWEEQARPPGLLWGADVLADLTRHVPAGVLSELECSFVATSYRHARRVRWIPRVLAALVLVGAFAIAVMKIRMAQEQARSAERVAEVTVTQAELEQGRSALLHSEPDALPHLAAAYQRDHSRSTAFMFARALQPRLAEQARFASTSGRMWSATFSPDGQGIVTTDDQSAQVRDAQTGRLLCTLPHGDTVYHAAYSADGARLVTAGGDGTVKIWDPVSGALVRELRSNGANPRYYFVAFSPDGKLVAAIDLKGEATRVWDASNGELLAELRDDASEFPGLAFSGDGRWLATSGGNDVRVFDVRTWTQAVVIPGPRIHALSFDRTSPRLLTGSADGDSSIWAIPSGARIHHLREIGEPVDAVAFSPDGQLVVAASRDGSEQVWKTASGTIQSQGNHLRGKILSIEFDPTSKLVVAAGVGGNVVVADAALGMPVAVLDGATGVMRVAHFDPTSRRVVGASWDGTARVWDATSPYRQWGSPPVADDCGLILSLEPDQRFVAVGCRGQQTRVWDTARDQLLAELPSVTPAGGDFTSAFPAVSNEGDRAAIARGNTVEIYELPGGTLARTITHGAAVNTVAFATSGHDLVSGAIDGSLLVTRDGRDPFALPSSAGGIDAAGFLADGRIAAATGKRLRIYDPNRNAVLAELAVPARIRTLRSSPDSRRLIAVPNYAGEAAPPVLWDVEHYRIVAKLDGAQVYSARFVADGHEIVTACADGAARLWDGATGQLRQTYRGGSRFLVDAALAPDGSMIVGGGGDGVLRFWDTITGRPLWKMPAHKSHVVGLHFEGDDIVTHGFSGDMSRWRLPRPQQVIEACGDHERCAIVSR